MAGNIFQIKAGDVLPMLEGYALERTGEPLATPTGLALATGVHFHLRPSGVATALLGDAGAAGTIINGPSCHMGFALATGLAAGRYQGEFEILWKSGQSQRVPVDGQIPVVVLDSI